MFCPNCGKGCPEGAVYCPACQARLPDAPKVELRKDLPSPDDDPAVPGAPSVKKISPKAIVGMVLGLNGLAMATVNVVFVMAALGSSSWDQSSRSAFGGMMLVYGLIGLGLGIPALILGAKGTREGSAPSNHGMGKCGRVTGLITVILCGISLLVALIIAFGS